MILQDELQKIVDNNTIAKVNLTGTIPLDVVPGHENKIVDTTKLVIDVIRVFTLFTGQAVGNNKIVVAGDKTSNDEIKRIATENMLRNQIRKRIKEITDARPRME